ncbi:hypothetical protein [Phocaeicola dorei]|jgi:hypothetical protein|uniref:hypothetical protein n=1 Tax=Phocaeicola dorei TaxID=357276 RepID=UPI001BDED396|nr:hypothetical protein [Phocaeicola dorei]MBT1285903.1 hypothetical protein [Phocaeicola dorei]MBT1289771.1 hypothetical protein [Phocaeicola dorei]
MKSKAKNKKENPYKLQFEQIENEAIGCRYCDMFDWQRKDLSKDELFEYAEEMRKTLNKIFDLALDARLNN